MIPISSSSSSQLRPPSPAPVSSQAESKPRAQPQNDLSGPLLEPENDTQTGSSSQSAATSSSSVQSHPSPLVQDPQVDPVPPPATPVVNEEITGIQEVRYITVLPKDGLDYFLEFWDKEGATVAKCCSCFFNWIVTCIPDLSSRVLFGAETVKTIASFYGFFQAPSQITQCIATIVNCYDDGPTLEKVCRAAKKGIDFLASLAQGAGLLALINAVSSAFVKSSKNFCHGMIFFGSLVSLCKTGVKIYKKEWNLELNQWLYYGAKILQDICYIVFPILMFLVGLGFSVPPLFILLVITAGLGFTVIRFIIKRTSDPKGAMSRNGYRLVLNTGQVPGEIAFGHRDSKYYKVYLRA